MYSSDQPQLANQLPISVSLPPDSPEFQDAITLLYKRIANAVNSKEGGLYTLQESTAFQQYFTSGNPQAFRPVYRKTINFGALPNAATKSVAHGIAFGTTFALTRMYGAATDPVNLIYKPLPYASPTLNQNIELNADATNVNITTGVNLTAFTICTVVIEYTKYQ